MYGNGKAEGFWKRVLWLRVDRNAPIRGKENVVCLKWPIRGIENALGLKWRIGCQEI